MLVGRGGVEPPTFHFSGGRSYQLSYLPERAKPYRRGPARPKPADAWRGRAGAGPGLHATLTDPLPEPAREESKKSKVKNVCLSLPGSGVMATMSP